MDPRIYVPVRTQCHFCSTGTTAEKLCAFDDGAECRRIREKWLADMGWSQLQNGLVNVCPLCADAIRELVGR